MVANQEILPETQEAFRRRTPFSTTCVIFRTSASGNDPLAIPKPSIWVDVGRRRLRGTQPRGNVALTNGAHDVTHRHPARLTSHRETYRGRKDGRRPETFPEADAYDSVIGYLGALREPCSDDERESAKQQTSCSSQRKEA